MEIRIIKLTTINILLTLIILTLVLGTSCRQAKTSEAPSDSIRIAIVQQNTIPGNLEENRNKALDFAKQALDQKADVILFHEELIVGYVNNIHELAEPLDGPTTQAFQSLLKGSQALIIYGLTEEDGDKYYISAPVVSADRVLCNYRKTHLWWKSDGLRHEPTYYSPGNQLVTLNIKGHKCGFMICYDGDFPEMTSSYANLGCSVLFWMNNRNSRGHNEVRGLARRNSMIFATSCCCGLTEDGEYARGGSNITDANGELLCEIWDEEGIIIADVQPGKVPNLRDQNPWYMGRRPKLYR